jgi:hypothetical protein
MRYTEREAVNNDKLEINLLEQLLQNPKQTLLNLQEITIMENSLTHLKKRLEKRELSLKGSRNRKAIDTITNILKENKITEFKKNFEEYSRKRSNMIDSDLLNKREKFEGIKNTHQRKKIEFFKISNEKKRIEKAIRSIKIRMDEYESRFGELIQKP